MSNIATKDDLSALNREITDEEGNIKEDDTSEEETETPKETTEEEAAPVEKPAETEEPSPKGTEESESEPEMVELAADESGKRYVPESRFKEVYGKMKAAERETAELKKQKPKVTEPTQAPTQPKPLGRIDALEIEQLRSALPQFNPDSKDYSREIDELGFSLYEGSKDNLGNYAMTRIEAGRKAVDMAKKITSKVAEIKSEAKSVKAQQSDQGVTSRVLRREGEKLDIDKMTLEEKEEWLKAEGYW